MTQPNDDDASAAHRQLQQAISALTQQLADRAATGRPMRASLQGAYRAVLDRELVRLGSTSPRRSAPRPADGE